MAEVGEGRIRWARIALGAVAPTVVRLTGVERLLQGASGIATVRERALAACHEAVKPIDDQRSTAEYRRVVAGNLVGLFLDRLEIALRQL